MLNEVALRKESWSEGEWIGLGDGQRWSFPLPRLIEFRPTFGPDGTAKIADVSVKTHGPGYLARLDDLIASEGGVEQVEKIASLGAELLLKNYNLDGDQLGSLLSYVVEEDGELDPASREMWAAICHHAAGLSKKEAGGVGSKSE